MALYDRVPYPLMTYSYTHPDRLAVVGRLMGLDVASPVRCKVLDLGCGSGANLIAMAEHLPESQFFGIDLSSRQINQGREMVEHLGLQNVDLRQADIMDLPDAYGSFDYIIAHGLYSWVPEEARQKSLRLIKQSLAPQGIAYVSYNAYPGWHQIEAVRDLMRYRTRYLSDPPERARAARDIVALIAHAHTDTGSFGTFARHYYATALGRGEVPESFLVSTLLHDELADVNQPLYFFQFIEAAGRFDLEYLAEADLEGATPVGLSTEIREALGAVAHDRIEMEQYLDFLRDRGFRKTLLCHKGAPVARTLQANGAALSGLYVASPMKRQRPRKADNPTLVRFEAPDGLSYSTDQALFQAAFSYLEKLYPAATLFEDVVEAAVSAVDPGITWPQAADALAGVLLRNFLLSRSLVEFYVTQAQLTRQPGRKPRVPAFARLLAASGETRVTNLRHETVELESVSVRLLPLLDGEHSLEALAHGLSNPDRPAATR